MSVTISAPSTVPTARVTRESAGVAWFSVTVPYDVRERTAFEITSAAARRWFGHDVLFIASNVNLTDDGVEYHACYIKRTWPTPRAF